MYRTYNQQLRKSQYQWVANGTAGQQHVENLTSVASWNSTEKSQHHALKIASYLDTIYFVVPWPTQIYTSDIILMC